MRTTTVTAVGTMATAMSAATATATARTVLLSSPAVHLARRFESIPRGGASKEDATAADAATAASRHHHEEQQQQQQKDSQASSPSSASKSSTAAKKKKKKPTTRRPSETSSSTDESTEAPPSPRRRQASSSSSTTSGNSNTKQEPNSNTNEKNNSSNNSSKSMSPLQERIVNEILKEDDYYKILGTTREATATEIQKAYRKRAVLTHPDKMPNSDRRAFDKVSEAYDVLSDDTKRRQYNQFGKTGSGGGGVGGAHSMSPEDLFRSFFSSHSHPFFRSSASPPTAAKPRNRNVRYQLEVTLDDLYNGLTKSVLVSHPSPFGDLHRYHQPKRKRVEVHIPPGSFSGQSIVLSGEMDWDQEQTPADIVFILVQRPHATFTRKGYDLAMEMTISLEEAIGGVRRSITHLDGRTIMVESAHNAHSDIPLIIQSGAVQVLKGEGMPKRNGKGHGDLYVQYKVDMPSPTATRQFLTDTERDDLKHLLSKLQKQKHHPFHHQSHHDEEHHHHHHQHHKVKEGEEEEEQSQEPHVRILQTASANDFGRNGPEPEDEDHDAATAQEEEPHEDEASSFRSFPFGGGSGRQFFFSSSSGTESHPFFRDDWKDDGNGNVQCQQM